MFCNLFGKFLGQLKLFLQFREVGVIPIAGADFGEEEEGVQIYISSSGEQVKNLSQTVYHVSIDFLHLFIGNPTAGVDIFDRAVSEGVDYRTLCELIR